MPNKRMLKIMLIAGKGLTKPPALMAFVQMVRPIEAINRINTKNAEPTVKKLFLKNGRSFFTFQTTLRVDSIVRKTLAAPHKKKSKPIIAMAIEVCLRVEMLLIISSMPTGKTCLRMGNILSITPSDEPRINREKERSPKINGKRLKTVACTNAAANNGQRSALNF